MTQLKLLTWNIWMMPGWTLQSPKNEARAASIADELLTHDFDVLCLVKSFDAGARGVIERKLAPSYPYRYGPLNQHGSPFKINGGVWVLSKLPLSELRELQFDEATGIEAFSRKGAMLLRGCVNGQHFQLLATHLQGDDSPSYQPKRQTIRNHQMLQIAKELLRPHSDPSLPLFLCGDFCTPRRDPNDPFSESDGYRDMLATFSAINGAQERLTLDDRRVHNDLAVDDGGRLAELDYVLLRAATSATCQPQGTWERFVFRRRGWDGAAGRQDLSYRYAVSATFTW